MADNLPAIPPPDPTLDPLFYKSCPKCGGPVVHGYGYVTGGLGGYALCESGRCGWSIAQLDTEDVDG